MVGYPEVNLWRDPLNRRTALLESLDAAKTQCLSTKHHDPVKLVATVHSKRRAKRKRLRQLQSLIV
jgi:hypothetical protein